MGAPSREGRVSLLMHPVLWAGGKETMISGKSSEWEMRCVKT